ncbi:MAG: stage 0 sporulation family protein, partial [Oscillospiraceae bacterium]|nr:stage 0 sporulation family protein [Oscillospiraceae bacterium]
SYYFDPEDVEYTKGEKVIVETARGVEIGDVSFSPTYVSEEAVRDVLKPVLRRATEEDLRIYEENCLKEKEALQICKEKVLEHGLDMNLVDAQFTFDGKKITFYFTSDDRVDFRELVRDLASIFHIRIELRQIGVRDESRMMGGIGVCGQPFCCCRFLPDFQSVTIKMAKEQGKSLSPTKISGACGRLMCCLKYEQDLYEELSKLIPSVGSYVSTPDGRGTVIEANILLSNVKVKMEETEAIKLFSSDEVTKIAGGRIRKTIAGAQKARLQTDIENT